MSRSLRTLSVLTRPANFSRPLTRSRHSLLRRNGDITVQRVHFKTNLPRHAKRLYYQLLIGSGLCFALGRMSIEGEETVDNAGVLIEAQSMNTENLDGGAQEDDKVDEDDFEVPDIMPEDAFFIPLGRIRQRPHTPYKGSDPEWQSFVEFGNDQERRVAVRKELADLVCSSFARMKGMQGQLGVPIKLGRVWLDIIVPYGPPPEYERSGLEIADDYIAWTTRPVSALQVARFNSALRPLPVTKSLWASYRTYCSLQLARLKQFLNVAPAPSNTSIQLPAETITVEQLREKSSKQETEKGPQMNRMSDPKSDVSNTKGSAKSASWNDSKFYESLPSLPQPGSDIGPAVMEFNRTLAKNWRPPSAVGERGTLVVRGDVELKGPIGSYVLEIEADYHPREAKYVTVRAGFKYFFPRRQHPRRTLPEPKESGS